MSISKNASMHFSLSAIAAAATILSACSGSSSPNNITLNGVVSASGFVPGSATDPTIKAGYYQGAMVCVDANNNGKCDPSENPVTTDSNGKFAIAMSATAPLIADIGTSATNTATGQKVTTRNVFRATIDQVNEQVGGTIVLSPLSSEVARLTEANSSIYATEKQNLATRIGVPVATVLTDVNTATGTTQAAMLTEANALSNRFAYAITKLDRGDLYPDALAVPGGDPRLTGLTNVTALTATTPDTRTTSSVQRRRYPTLRSYFYRYVGKQSDIVYSEFAICTKNQRLPESG